MLNWIGADKPYICIDTFDGFVDEQLATDVALRHAVQRPGMFSGTREIWSPRSCSAIAAAM